MIMKLRTENVVFTGIDSLAAAKITESLTCTQILQTPKELIILYLGILIMYISSSQTVVYDESRVRKGQDFTHSNTDYTNQSIKCCGVGNHFSPIKLKSARLFFFLKEGGEKTRPPKTITGLKGS